MKKIFFALSSILLVTNLSFSQYSNPYSSPKKVEVTVKKNPYDFSGAITSGMQAGAAARAARAQSSAAYTDAMRDNFTQISIDLLINDDEKYKAVVIDNVTGWKPSVNKSTILKTLRGANKLYVYSSRKKIAENLKNSPHILYLNWQREAQGDYTRVTKMTLKDFQGTTVYEARYKNISFSEMLSPLTTKYILTKQKAIVKIKELKEFFELGLISKDEYDSNVKKLKPYILGN